MNPDETKEEGGDNATTEQQPTTTGLEGTEPASTDSNAPAATEGEATNYPATDTTPARTVQKHPPRENVA